MNMMTTSEGAAMRRSMRCGRSSERFWRIGLSKRKRSTFSGRRVSRSGILGSRSPLQIERHGWYLSPSLQPYGGGSVQILPRDFIKLGQLMLNGGTWNGRRLLDRKFVTRARSNLCALNKVGYGYLWWTTELPYKDRQVRAFWAGGNGGQGVMVVPELELVIATFGGSYITREGLEIQQGYAARYILPAVREPGDATDPSVKQQDYELL